MMPGILIRNNTTRRIIKRISILKTLFITISAIKRKKDNASKKKRIRLELRTESMINDNKDNGVKESK